MSPILRDARILVADDQVDVAKTLCEPLRAVGSVVRHVADGVQAFAEVRRGGYDLMVLDMKMPPEDWGGLWVMEQLTEARLRIPVVVLSGEGGKRQTIQAIRLGAKDWIDKEDAFADLLPRCATVLERAHAEAFDGIAAAGPSPLAHRFARYQAASPERSVSEGLRALEEVIRFAALVGLATLDPAAVGPLRGVSADQIARPSLGTWNTILSALQPVGEAGSAFSSICRAVAPHKNSAQRIRALIKLRNDIAHGGHEPSDGDCTNLREFLIEVAHRISTGWPWQIAVSTSMEYDGSTFFDVQTLRFAGLGQPRPVAQRSATPPRTGTVLLIGAEDSPLIPLTPWFYCEDSALSLYDGVRLRQRGEYDAAAPLLFADPISSRRGIQARATEGGTWSHIAPWFAG